MLAVQHCVRALSLLPVLLPLLIPHDGVEKAAYVSALIAPALLPVLDRAVPRRVFSSLHEVPSGSPLLGKIEQLPP